jgi:hypothetical protein
MYKIAFLSLIDLRNEESISNPIVIVTTDCRKGCQPLSSYFKLMNTFSKAGNLLIPPAIDFKILPIYRLRNKSRSLYFPIIDFYAPSLQCFIKKNI